VDDVKVDSTGNVIAHKRGRHPNFMLVAHMDEIGLMVREITSDGLLLCAAVGGINPLSMVGSRVTVQGKTEVIHGIVTTREISCGDEVEELPGVEDLVVDTGLTTEKLAKLGVTVGAFLEPMKEANWLTFGNTISGKALDDRLGCYCLLEIAQQLQRTDQEVYYVFTVQEEVSMQGGKTSAFAIHPHWAIVVDVTLANDLSTESQKPMGTHLAIGKGPCLLHMEEGFIPNIELVQAIKQVADKHKIPIQHEVSGFGTTDASSIAAVRRGVPSANISIAIRNIHSIIEIANRKDVNYSITLIAELLKHPPVILRSSLTKRKKGGAVPQKVHTRSRKKGPAKPGTRKTVKKKKAAPSKPKKRKGR
jgi:endoglucanase